MCVKFRAPRHRAQNPHKIFLFASMAGASLYGGLLGIGIGSFVLALLVSIGGYGLSKALAHSRWVVFSINIASTLFFVLGGNVLWVLGSIMCVGQIIGATLGARLAIKHGAKIIRPIVICVCFALSVQLLVREFFIIALMVKLDCIIGVILIFFFLFNQ